MAKSINKSAETTSKPTKPASKKAAAKHEPVAITALSQAEAEALARQGYQTLLDLPYDQQFLKRDEVRKILKADPVVLVGIVRRLAEATGKLRQELPSPVPPGTPLNAENNRIDFIYYQLSDHKSPNYRVNNYPYQVRVVVDKALKSSLPFTAEDFEFILGRMADFELVSLCAHPFLAKLFDQLQHHAAEHGVSAPLAEQIQRLADAMDSPKFTQPGNSGSAAQRRAVATLRALAQMAN